MSSPKVSSPKTSSPKASSPLSSPAPKGSEEEVLGQAYDTKLMLRLWTYVRDHGVLLAFALLLIPITVAFEIAQPYLLSVAIDVYITNHVTDGLGTLALVYVGFVIMQALCGYAQLYALQLVGQRSMHSLRLATYRHILTRRSAFFDRIPVGRLLTRMTNDIESINEMFAGGVVTLLADVVRLIAIVGMMLYLNVQLTLITFITIPALVILVRYARKLMRSSYRQIRVKLAAMNTHLQEHLSGIGIVQLFVREKATADKYDEINAEYREAYSGSIMADASMYAIVEAIGLISVAAIAWYSGATIGETGLTIGLVVAFIEYVNKFFIPIKDFSAKYAVMQSAMAAAERIVGLLDTKEEDAPMRTADASITGSDSFAVEFKDVKFSYREGEQVLKGLGLSVRPGEKVAVVGATGSGKSTLIKLLARLYETDEGAIFLDGQNILSLPAGELRRHVTVVNQDVFLFKGTIADNVRMGNPDASDDDVTDALRRIGAESVFKGSLADSQEENAVDIHLMIEDRGDNLSAGQRQLVAFARALVRDPKLLILDEATAHVDPKTESAIERGLDALMRGRTTLVIAHRLSTIANADKIVVLDHGVVAETGTYDSLVEDGGLFAQLQKSFSSHQSP
ncbi:MAG: ABC transporter ATP-binding protein [Kofleriaceae bacterium]|nr:ABC transporter ATP-binding protein [Kofleriaceae bacterium]